jgi:Flp pilus assembly protein TadG
MLKFMPKKFAKDRHASIALITAIAILPLLLFAVGVPIDLARAIQYRATLQNVADAAALAGSEALGVGATPAQACALTLAYANIPITNGELPASATPSATLTSPGAAPLTAPSVYNCPVAASTPEITTADAPDSVNVTISGSEPMTFLAAYKPSIPETVSTTVIGPQGFITICADPQPNQSGDLSQVYYYLLNPDGSLTNEAGSPSATTSTGILPTANANGVVSLSAFLGDDKFYPPNSNNKPAITPGLGYLGSGYCDAAHTQIAVQVKSGLAQRLGFAYYVISNAQAPCGADPKLIQPKGYNAFAYFACLTNNQNYQYDPTVAGNIGGFFTYYGNDTPAGTHFLPNAYGSPLGWVNAFFSTDYPASLNTDNYEASGNNAANGNAASPLGGDTCYTTYTSATSSTISTVYNGFAAINPNNANNPIQSCIINESVATVNKALSVLFGIPISPNGTYNGKNYGYPKGTNVVSWDNWVKLAGYGGTTATGTDLVCLVNNGASYTPATLKTYNKGTNNQYSVATVAAGVAVQQENFVIANNTAGENGTVYHCPVDTVGSKWYPDPTCAELNGATLQIGWNDMGGLLSDDGNYVDLVYSYSCNPPAAETVINSAIIQ